MLKAVITSNVLKTVKAEVNTSILKTISAQVLVSLVGNGYKDYEGEYIVTPTLDTQTLPTKKRGLIDDITVNPIPVTRYMNEYGGETVIIG